MKHLKTFENSNNPEVGDYVQCEEQDNSSDNGMKLFISSNIGKIVEIRKTAYPFSN